MNLKDYLDLTEGWEIIRRYFAMNGFDGVLTTFGILLGSLFAGTMSPREILFAIIGASIAMGVSGMWGAFIVELSERKREIKEINRAMHKNIENSKIGRAMLYTAVIAGIVDGMSPLIFSILNIIPIFLSYFKVIGIELALKLSLVLSLVLLFSLGFYLGKIARENPVLFGAKMVLAAAIIAIFVKIFGIIA